MRPGDLTRPLCPEEEEESDRDELPFAEEDEDEPSTKHGVAAGGDLTCYHTLVKSLHHHSACAVPHSTQHPCIPAPTSALQCPKVSLQ